MNDQKTLCWNIGYCNGWDCEQVKSALCYLLDALCSQVQKARTNRVVFSEMVNYLPRWKFLKYGRKNAF